MDALWQGTRRWSCGLGHLLPLTIHMTDGRSGSEQLDLHSYKFISSEIILLPTHSRSVPAKTVFMLYCSSTCVQVDLTLSFAQRQLWKNTSLLISDGEDLQFHHHYVSQTQISTKIKDVEGICCSENQIIDCIRYSYKAQYWFFYSDPSNSLLLVVVWSNKYCWPCICCLSRETWSRIVV